MATKKLDINNYCNCLYTELSSMKESLGAFLTQIDLMEGKDKSHFHSHVRHLNELIKTIDWKLEIFSKECPIDLSAIGKEVESTVSVPSSGPLKESDYPAGGYAGG